MSSTMPVRRRVWPGLTLLVLGEIPTVWGLVGGVICLVGVGLTRRRSR